MAEPTRRFIRGISAGLAALLLLGCLGGSDRVAGTSSETTNTTGLTGWIRTESGQPVPGAIISLRPESHVGDTAGAQEAKSEDSLAKPSALGPGRDRADIKSDSLGRFRLDSLAPGAYALTIRADDASGLTRLERLRLAGDVREIDLLTLVLRAGISLTGRVSLPAQHGPRAYVQVVGTDRVARSDDSGRFRLNGLAAGANRLRISAAAPELDPVLLTVDASPGESLDVGEVELASFEAEDYSQWPFSRRIRLNPALLAGLTAAARDFPLLVRLDTSRIDFSKAGPAGLRFSDGAGKHLRYHVQAWDSAAGSAAVWVRLDAVPAGAPDFGITMHWGLQGAHDWSDAAIVLGSENGFSGAWHLDEDGAGIGAVPVYLDASGGGSTGDDYVLTPSEPGIVGRAAKFMGGDRIRVTLPSPALRPTQAVYLAAWIRTGRTDTLGGTVASLGENYGMRIQPDGEALFSVAKADGSYARLKSKGAALMDGKWHHLACQLDRNTLQIYVDGNLNVREANTSSIAYPFGSFFYIGAHGNSKPSFDFLGNIDEVRVTGRGRLEDWIRLGYENEKPGSSLLQFE